MVCANKLRLIYFGVILVIYFSCSSLIILTVSYLIRSGPVMNKQNLFNLKLGHIGVVKDATESTARVELHANCQTISVDRTRIAVVGAPSKANQIFLLIY